MKNTMTTILLTMIITGITLTNVGTTKEGSKFPTKEPQPSRWEEIMERNEQYWANTDKPRMPRKL